LFILDYKKVQQHIKGLDQLSDFYLLPHYSS